MAEWHSWTLILIGALTVGLLIGRTTVALLSEADERGKRIELAILAAAALSVALSLFVFFPRRQSDE
jgi:hypothetical protein